MRVLFVLTYYHPHWTGLTQYSKRVAEGLAKKDWQVRVLTTKHDSHLPTDEVLAKVTVKREPVWFRISRTLVSPKLLVDLIGEIKNTERIIIFLPLAEVIWVEIWARIFNKPVYLVHNGDLVLPGGFFNRILEKIYNWTTGMAIASSKAIIIHTRDYAENSRVLSRYPEKWRVILPPIAHMRPDKKRVNELRSKVEIKKYKLVGFAGRFVEEKGIDVLLKAVPLVLRALPGIRFVFAGETNIPYEKFFEKNVDLWKSCQKHVTSVGLLPLEEMASFYTVCDVFVIPSRSDCFPVTQIEAMFCNTPVVVTDIPGASWPVRTTGMGVVVKTENPQSLADGIVTVLENLEKYKKRKSEIIKLFDYENSIKEYEQLISQN